MTCATSCSRWPLPLRCNSQDCLLQNHSRNFSSTPRVSRS